MPIQATVILDSGCFLPMDEDNNGAFTEIGYFESSKSISDIRVIADGTEVNYSESLNLGRKCKIEIRHVKANGKLKTDGVRDAPGFHKQLLHMKELYGEHIPVNRAKFDCIIRFDSGRFCAALVKPRYFNKHTEQADKTLAISPEHKPKLVNKPILHNVHVHFKLKKGEALELARNGEVFWSSKKTDAKDRLEIEIVADNTTTEKFYRMAFRDVRDSYWIPNSGDPPPMCSQPPCEPPGRRFNL